MNKISIALCTYNGARFLPAQLESILAQTRPPDEIFIGDDRSTDETVSLLEDFARRAPFPVHIRINEKNLGSTKNFEQTIKACTGDVIFLCDQDDIWVPEKIAVIESEFDRAENIGMVFTDAELIDEDGRSMEENLWKYSFFPEERARAKKGKIFEVLMRQNVVTGATTAFRARFRDVFLPIPDDISNTIHDAWIALIIAANAEVVMLEKCLIRYRQHSAQQAGVNWKFKGLSRRGAYERSVFFLREDLKRLSQMETLSRTVPEFRKAMAAHDFGSVIAGIQEEKEEWIRHFDARTSLPAPRMKRILPIWRELRTGRYHRFSKGILSAAKDMWENW